MISPEPSAPDFRSNTALGLCLALVLGMSLCLLRPGLLSLPEASSSLGTPRAGWTLGLLLGGALCELLACRLPYRNRFSLGAVFWLALGLVGQPLPALGGAVCSLTLYALLQSCQAHRLSLTAILADLAALITSLFILRLPCCSGSPAWSQLLVLSLVYPCSRHFLPYLLTAGTMPAAGLSQQCQPPLSKYPSPQSNELTRLIAPSQECLRLDKLMGVSVSIPALSYLLANTQHQLSGLVPLLFLIGTLTYAVRLTAQAALAQESSRLTRHLVVTSGKLEASLITNRQTRDALELQMDQYSFLQALSGRLSICQSPEEVCQTALDILRHAIPAHSYIIFLPDREELEPVYWHSPEYDGLLQSWSLLHLTEPVVQRAHSLHSLQTDSWPAETKKRNFPAELQQMAINIGAHGVIYLGRETPFTELQQSLLSIVSYQVSLAWLTAQSLHRCQTRLEELLTAHQSLKTLANRLECVLQSLQTTLDITKPYTILDEIDHIIRSIISTDYSCIVLGDLEYFTEPPQAKDNSQEQEQTQTTPSPEQTDHRRRALQELRLVACQNHRPLLLEDISSTRFPAPTPDTVSVLAVPIPNEQGEKDVIILGSHLRQAFTRQDQDLLCMLAFHISAIFRSYQLHQELKKAHESLTASQSTLLQSSKMAAVGQLAAGVAHELNTPLGAVIVGLDSALQCWQANRPERAQHRLELAKRSAQQAKSIISKLLFYARDARYGVRITDLNQIILDTLELIGHHLQIDHIRLQQDLPKLPACEVNQNEMQQVFTNLILNARDALKQLPEGQLRLIKIGTRSGPEGRIQAYVEDNGPGISPKLQKQIFDPFFTTKPLNSGTGLGLSVSYEIISHHHGSISLDSRPGCTRFTVTLPTSSG